MYGLNKSAAFVWRTLESMDDFECLLRAMAPERPDFGPDFGEKELRVFCDQLVELGLLEAAEPEGSSPVAVDPISRAEAPRILWEETLEQVAASCAFLPGQSALCNQVPSS